MKIHLQLHKLSGVITPLVGLSSSRIKHGCVVITFRFPLKRNSQGRGGDSPSAPLCFMLSECLVRRDHIVTLQ